MEMSKMLTKQMDGGHPTATKETTDADTEKTPRLKKLALLLVVVGTPVGTAWGIVRLWGGLVGWPELFALLLFYVLTVVGVGVGFHRMLTHRSFEAPAAVRFVFLALGSMALQGSAIIWASTHSKHHANSDKEGDPHSPLLKGFWRAHVGWLWQDLFVTRGVHAESYQKDRVAQIVDKTFYIWVVLGFVLPGLLTLWMGSGFWSGVLWGGVVRVFLVHHITWSVNSVCHTFGRRAFDDTPDQSRNEWIVGILGMGEGWHNNHHAFPKAAYHGMRWWQFDLNGYVIRLLKWTRLAKKVWMPKPEVMRARSMQKLRA